LLLAGGDKASQSKDITAAKHYCKDFRRLNMARRSKDWNVGLAQDLRDPNFAREFLLAANEEGVSIQIALGKVIRAIGIKEFSARIKIASPNILRAINPRHNPTQETLNRLLKPFRLKLSLAPIEQPKSRHAA
jgi:DNA-binding phage protein